MDLTRRALTSLALALFCVPALSDDTAVYGRGGAILPMTEHPSIVMDEMVIQAHVSEKTTHVDCRFLFRNTGPGTTVRMGFPEAGNHLGGTDGFTTFETWVDGEPYEVSVEGPPGEPSALVWRRWRVKAVEFAAEQSRRVRVRYTVATTRDSVGGRGFEYTFGTGGSWKGPIGRAQITVALEGRFSVRPRGGLTPVAVNLFRWEATDLEPAESDSVGLYLMPPDLRIEVSGLERGYPGRVDSDGISWAPITEVAKWIGAEAAATPGGATVTYGSLTLEIFADTDKADLGGERISLPAPPVSRDSALHVPIAAGVRALGGTVSYDAALRAILISLPLTNVLEADGRIPPEPVYRTLSREFPGWAPPLEEQYAPEVWHAPREGSWLPPWMALGDFDGDGVHDLALLLLKGDETGIGIVHARGGSPAQFSWFPGSPHSTIALLDGTLFTVLQTQPPGEVAYYVDGEQTPRSGSLHLEHDALQVIAWGKAASLWYWDEVASVFKRVTIAD
jgi:hypothetical protein